jgi:hypothetical protein
VKRLVNLGPNALLALARANRHGKPLSERLAECIADAANTPPEVSQALQDAEIARRDGPTQLLLKETNNG